MRAHTPVASARSGGGVAVRTLTEEIAMGHFNWCEEQRIGGWNGDRNNLGFGQEAGKMRTSVCHVRKMGRKSVQW